MLNPMGHSWRCFFLWNNTVQTIYIIIYLYLLFVLFPPVAARFPSRFLWQVVTLNRSYLLLSKFKTNWNHHFLTETLALSLSGTSAVERLHLTGWKNSFHLSHTHTTSELNDFFPFFKAQRSTFSFHCVLLFFFFMENSKSWCKCYIKLLVNVRVNAGGRV